MILSAVSQSLDQLLGPVSDEFPQGQDPEKHASVIYAEMDLNCTKALQWEAEVPTANPDQPKTYSEALKFWEKVQECATSILSVTGKDMRAARCLVEASVRLSGFSGLLACVPALAS